MRGAEAGADFDVMLETKLKDVALLQLRADLRRYAPDIAAAFAEDLGQEQTNAGPDRA